MLSAGGVLGWAGQGSPRQLPLLASTGLQDDVLLSQTLESALEAMQLKGKTRHQGRFAALTVPCAISKG